MMRAQGILVEIDEDRVKTLVEYGLERRVYVFPRSFFSTSGVSLEPGQKCSIEFQDGENEPQIQVLSTFVRGRPVSMEASIEDTQELLGIKPGDKVAVVLSGVHIPDQPTDLRHSLLWGEAYGQSQIGTLLSTCGILPEDLEYFFPEQAYSDDVQSYSNTHMVFLGSIRSNNMLRDLFWSSLEPGLDVTVPPVGEGKARIGVKSTNEEWFYEDLKPNVSKDAPVPHEPIHIRDPFFVAVTENPFDKSGYHRCILSCGAGSFGTGYGTIVLTARESIECLADNFRPDKMVRPKWCVVCRVEINGPLHTLSLNDPVECLHGLRNAPFEFLSQAISSPRIWHPRPQTSEGIIADVLRRYGRLAENGQ